MKNKFLILLPLLWLFFNACTSKKSIDYMQNIEEVALEASAKNAKCPVTLVVKIPIDKTIAANGLMHEGIVSTQMGLPGLPAVAEELMEIADLPIPEEDEEPGPVGHLGILADLGLNEMEISAICDDEELFPDEQLEAIAARLGFGDEFSELLDL